MKNSNLFSGQEKGMIERFENEMTRVERRIREKLAWRGLVYTLSDTIPLFSYAFTMYYGAHLIAAKEIHFKNVIKLVENRCFNFGNVKFDFP